MSIKVNFKEPTSISSGIYRDTWVATIRDPEFFISSESKLRIPMNTKDAIKVPSMMPDTEFTKTFIAMSSVASDVAKTTLVGNFVTNLILSGAMHFLWGLIHCL